MYDIFYVSRQNIDEDDWNSFSARFPTSKKIENVKTFKDLTDKAFTKLFWVVWSDVVVDNNFNLDYTVPKWDAGYIHVFKNGDHYDGINIFPKSASVSQKEFDHRFFSNKKEIDIVASTPKVFDVFTIDSYSEYLEALENSTTDMFWMTSKNIKPYEDFKFDIYISHHSVQDREQNHAFKHLNDSVESYNGIFLCSKKSLLTKKEVEYRFPINRKEWPIVASTSAGYNRSLITTYQDYLEVMDRTDGTELIWVVPLDVDVLEEFQFDTYFSHDNEFDRKMNHVFLNGNDYDGVMLLSKHKPVSEREFKHRFIVDKKEWPIQASKPRNYPIFYIDTWEEYQEALEKSPTEMFWMSSRNLQPAEDFKFDIYFSHHNSYDRGQNHAFIHRVNGKDTFNGIFLCSKNKVLTKKEVEHRFPIERKEWDIVASGPVAYTRYVAN